MDRTGVPLLAMPDGFIVRPVPLSDIRFYVPQSVRVEGNELRWDPLPRANEDLESLLGAEPLDAALNAFIALAEHVDSAVFGDAVERFARRWGPLGPCCTHTPFGRAWGSPVTCGCPPDLTSEPLDVWADLSWLARGLAKIAISLARNEPVTSAEWDALPTEWRRWWQPEEIAPSGDPVTWHTPTTYADPETTIPMASAPLSPIERTLGSDRLWLSILLARWLNAAHIRFSPGLHIELARPGVSLHIPTLAAALGVALTGAITASRLAVCDECGSAYEWRRRPRPDRQHYCDLCREPDVNGYGRNRAAKRAWWRKNRSKAHVDTAE